MAPRFRAKSSYTEDFQTSQAGPKERRADTAEDIKAADTTLDLHRGNTRATHHLPGRSPGSHMTPAFAVFELMPHQQVSSDRWTLLPSLGHVPMLVLLYHQNCS